MVRAWIVWFAALNLVWFALIDQLILAEQRPGDSFLPPPVAATGGGGGGTSTPIQVPAPLGVDPSGVAGLPLADPRGDGLGARCPGAPAGGRPAKRGSFRRVPVSLPADRDRAGHQAGAADRG